MYNGFQTPPLKWYRLVYAGGVRAFFAPCGLQTRNQKCSRVEMSRSIVVLVLHGSRRCTAALETMMTLVVPIHTKAKRCVRGDALGHFARKLKLDNLTP